MICPKCGNNNENDATFCEECGQTLSSPQMGQPVFQVQQMPQMGVPPTVQPPQIHTPQMTPPPPMAPPPPQMGQAPAYYGYGQATVAKTPQKKMKAKTKVLLVFILILVVAAIALYMTGQKLTAPGKVMQDYMDLMKAQNFSQAYDMMSVPDSDFTTREAFENSMKVDDNFKTIASYSYTDLLSKAGDNIDGRPVKKYKLTIKQTGSKKQKDIAMTLVSQKSKKWVLYTDWKVSAEPYIVEDAVIAVPKDVTITVDNIELDPSYVDVDGSYTNTSVKDHYKIPVIFKGLHMITANADGCEPSETTFEPQTGVETEVEPLDVAQEVKDVVGEKANEVLKAIYAGAMNGKPFSDLSGYFVKDKEIINRCKMQYEKIVDLVNLDDGNGLKSLELNSFSAEISDDASQENMGVNIKYNYSYTYCKKDYRGKIEEYTPREMSEGASYFKFEKADEEWLVSNMNDIQIYVHG